MPEFLPRVLSVKCSSSLDSTIGCIGSENCLESSVNFTLINKYFFTVMVDRYYDEVTKYMYEINICLIVVYVYFLLLSVSLPICLP